MKRVKEQIIQSYVNKITKTDIGKFATSNDIPLTEEEIDILYATLKKNWKVFLYGNPTPIFSELKTQLAPTTFEKGIELFYAMKQKYQSFL